MPDPSADQSPELPPEQSKAAPDTQAAVSTAPDEPSAGDAGARDPKAAATGAIDKSGAPALSGFPAVVEWFWQGHAMRRVHASGSTLSVRGRELLRRARIASEVGARAIEPSEPFPSGSADAVACELYRESVEWCLAAAQERNAVPSAEVPAARADLDASRANLETLWATTDASLFAKSPDASKLKAQIVNRSFRDFAELDATEQVRLARSLRAFSAQLIDELDVGQSLLDRLWLKRVLRLGLALAAIAAVVVLVFKASGSGEDKNDLATGAMWSASSVYGPEPGCTPPDQECASSPNFFIATEEEENPWLKFDLKKRQKLSSVRVDNRIDCCYERAVPLIIEISDDDKEWKEVARRTTDFSSWKATFPTVEARYVRLRIPKRTNLNLSRVRLLP